MQRKHNSNQRPMDVSSQKKPPRKSNQAPGKRALTSERGMRQQPKPHSNNNAPRKRNDSVNPAMATKTVKTKQRKPVTKGTIILISLVISILITALFAAALIMVSSARSGNDQAFYEQTLSDALNTVREASTNIALVPPMTVREDVVKPNANLRVTKYEDGNEVISYGAGVIVSNDKKTDKYYILTNYHVISNATKTVVTIGKKEYDADYVGVDETSDIGVISITTKDNLNVAKMDSVDIMLGDYTMSVGNPYGLNDSFSAGVISGVGRNMLYSSGPITITYANMIQIDTPINPGNSGGGLYNANGILIGINTLIISDDAHSDRIGYAIPTSYFKPIVSNLIAGQRAAHPSLGVTLSDVPQEEVEKYGLESHDGAYILSVTPSGPAEMANLIPGDIIIEYNGNSVKDAQDLLYQIRADVINVQHDLKILRGGKEIPLNIKVGSDV